jgi:cell division protein FtsL
MNERRLDRRMSHLEFAMKTDVRNAQVVRELDRQRQRELWRAALVGIGLVVLVLFSAWQHFELRRLHYQTLQLQQARTAELMARRHLQLEIATLKSPQRIEEAATKLLNMTAPAQTHAEVIERVTVDPPPRKSVVASRD